MQHGGRAVCGSRAPSPDTGVWSRQLELGGSFSQRSKSWQIRKELSCSSIPAWAWETFSPLTFGISPSWIIADISQQGLGVEAWENPEKEEILLLIITIANFYCWSDSLINIFPLDCSSIGTETINVFTDLYVHSILCSIYVYWMNESIVHWKIVLLNPDNDSVR